jgi:diaminopimelate decarboxylase
VTQPSDQPAIIVAGGRLAVEGVDAEELAARFGTPLYVMSESALRTNVRAWQRALVDAWPHGETRVLVSLKANPSIALRRILNEEGAGCDVFGQAELEIALAAGVPPHTISVNGSTKPAELIAHAIDVGARLTVDSIEELATAAAVARAAGATAAVRLRLRPDLTDVMTVSEFTEDVPLGAVADAYKPGIPLADLAALPSLDLQYVDLLGIHAHLGRHTADPAPFREHARRVGRLAGTVGDAFGGWRPREIDLGGGYSFPGDPTGRALRELDDAPAPNRYATELVDGLLEGLSDAGIDPAGIALEIEPGRAVYGSAGLHLSRVLHVKRQPAPAERTWVGCDSSEVLLSDTTWEHSRWEPVCAAPVDGEPVAVDVVGVSCGFDTIAASTPLPSGIAAGDLLAFLATGAYEETLAGNFNSMPRPATVLVRRGAAEVIRRREKLGDLLERERTPRGLGGSAPRVAGVDHVAITVADLDRSLAFYGDVLGLRVLDRGPIDPELTERMTGLPDADVEYADVELGTRTLELLCHRTLDPRRSAAGRPERPGSVHIGLTVDDARRVHERLTDRGFPPLSEPQTLPDDGSDWSGCVIFYVRDPDGVMLEIVERATPQAGRSAPAPTSAAAAAQS